MGLRIKRQKGKGRTSSAVPPTSRSNVIPLFLKNMPEPLVERLRELALRHGDAPTQELSKAVPEQRFMTDDLGVVTARKVRISVAQDADLRIVSEPLDDLSTYRLRN